MVIGVPRETHSHEHRVGLTPFLATRLSRQGHTVLVEKGAGEDAHFTDRHFENAGGQIVYTAEEIYQRADLVCRVSPLSPEELALLKPGSVVCGFHHLAVAPQEDVQRLAELETTLVGYEVIREADGSLPVLASMSEIAGQMAVHIGARYLQNDVGGRGVLLGSTLGVPPATVLILGAGSAGQAAARQALASGAHVIAIDADLTRLKDLHREFQGRVVTVVAGLDRLERYTAIADVVIGAVLIPGARAPFLVTEDMVQAMKQGSVIIDLSIDQGGCVETSRPTTLAQPVFTTHGVIHYCVPNLTANIARTASRSLANASIPYILELASMGLEEALGVDPRLARGLYMYRGTIVNEKVGKALGMPSTPLRQLINKGDRA